MDPHQREKRGRAASSASPPPHPPPAPPPRGHYDYAQASTSASASAPTTRSPPGGRSASAHTTLPPIRNIPGYLPAGVHPHPHSHSQPSSSYYATSSGQGYGYPAPRSPTTAFPMAAAGPSRYASNPMPMGSGAPVTGSPPRGTDSDGEEGGAGTGASDQPPKKKRRRQALSCTECKRRKIKCDRIQPCGPCIRRNEQDKCRWNVIEPTEKYVVRSDHDELRSKFIELQARLIHLESFVARNVPGYALPPHLAYAGGAGAGRGSSNEPALSPAPPSTGPGPMGVPPLHLPPYQPLFTMSPMSPNVHPHGLPEAAPASPPRPHPAHGLASTSASASGGAGGAGIRTRSSRALPPRITVPISTSGLSGPGSLGGGMQSPTSARSAHPVRSPLGLPPIGSTPPPPHPHSHSHSSVSQRYPSDPGQGRGQSQPPVRGGHSSGRGGPPNPTSRS